MPFCSGMNGNELLELMRCDRRERKKVSIIEKWEEETTTMANGCSERKKNPTGTSAEVVA